MRAADLYHGPMERTSGPSGRRPLPHHTPTEASR